MANRGQKGNREKRKPKAETVKSAPVTSRLISARGECAISRRGVLDIESSIPFLARAFDDRVSAK